MTGPPVLPAFPAVDAVCCDLLAGYGECGMRTPDDGLEAHMPYLLIHVIGGTSDPVTDYAAMDVDVFAASLPQAAAVSGQVQAFLEHSGPHVINGVVFDGFATSTRPHDIPYGLPGVYRTSATYRVSTRRQ
jgi:hypothetical protein